MKQNLILLKVYRRSQALIAAALLGACLLLHWTPAMTGLVMLASLVLAAPSFVSLHLLLWMVRRLHMSRAFAWMLLFACMPLLAFAVAKLTAGVLPGDTGFVLALGLTAAYAGILTHGLSIAQLFNPQS